MQPLVTHKPFSIGKSQPAIISSLTGWFFAHEVARPALKNADIDRVHASGAAPFLLELVHLLSAAQEGEVPG